MSKDSVLSPQSSVLPFLLLGAFAVFLHLPFLAQPVQSDDVNYLDIALNVFRQPLSPLDFHYVFLGRVVDMTGHPHPPLNAYLLALVWLMWGRFSATLFHVAYLVFALVISFAAYDIARRFTSRPLWAALLVASAPAMQVAGHTFEADAPAAAFMLLSAAFFFRRWFVVAGAALALAGFSALQALAMGPILLLDYARRRERPPAAAWMMAAAPFALLAAWQLLQFALTHRLPLAVLFGYATSPSFGRLGLKLSSALALIQHLGVLVVFLPLARQSAIRNPQSAILLVPGALVAAFTPGYPWWERLLLLGFVSAGVYTLLWVWSARRDEPFLAAWCLLYFLFTLLAFFAGAARYLLPLAAPLVFLFVRRLEARPRLLAAALAINIVVGLNLSFAAYELAGAYATLPAPAGRFLVNGEWGFRYQMTRQGGRMLEQRSAAAAGQWIVTSELSLGGNHGSPAEALAVPLETRELAVRSPLRVLDRFAHSGFASVAFGLLPFSFSRRSLDRITYARISPYLELDARWRPTQFSGRLVYLPEPGAVIRLPIEPGAKRLHFALFAGRSGVATFVIRDSGGEIFRRSVSVSGELWEPQNIAVDGLSEVTLSLDAPATVRAGWGDLVPF